MSSAPQTSVSAPSSPPPGKLHGSGNRLDPATSEESSDGIAQGSAVIRGSATGLVKLPTDPHTDTTKLVGIAVFGHAYNRDNELDTDGYQPGSTFGMLRKGQISVRVEDAVTPDSEVHVRMLTDGDSLAGAFRGSVEGKALAVADFTYTANAGTDLLTKVAHTLKTGDGPFRTTNSGGGLPGGLAAATDYWVIRNDDDTFQAADSLANALAGTAIDITSAGTGTHTWSDTASTETLATVEISKFASFRDSADAGETAVLEVDFGNAALAELG